MGYGETDKSSKFTRKSTLLVALLFSNLTGRRYPHLAPVAGNQRQRTKDILPRQRVGTSVADVKSAMADYGEIIDMNPQEIDALLHQAQIRSFDRRSGEIISRDVLTVAGGSSLGSAWRVLIRHHLRALPVISADGTLEGIITQSDFMAHAILAGDGQPRLGFRK